MFHMNFKVRLTDFEIHSIKSIVEQHDPEARIYLYGSRTNLLLKGGDIDLLLVSERLKFNHKIDILLGIKNLIGEQRIDLSIKSHEEFKHDSFFNQDHIINSLFQL